MEKKIQKSINIIFAALVIIGTLFFELGYIFLPNDHPEMDYACTEYGGKWERVLENGQREEITVPGKCDAQRGETVTLETILPDTIENNRYLCFRSAKQDMKFYIDGEIRQVYSTKNSRLFGKMSAAAYVFLEIKTNDAGKTLRVETVTDSSYSGYFYTVYYGNAIGIWKMFYDKFGIELMVAFITLILSAIVIAASVILRVFYHRKVALEYLGWGILFAAVWLITNSNFRQLIFRNLSVVNDFTFLTIMILPLPFSIYMNEIQKGRYRIFYQIFELIAIVNMIACTFFHMSGIRDFTDTIGHVAALCIASILLMIITMLIDYCKGRIKEYKFVAIGISAVCVAAAVQILTYFRRSSQFNGTILAIGLILLLIFATISTVYEIVYMDREKQQALRASEAKGRFLANMSHEIRTPINAVLGMDAMILRESTQPEIKGYALDIQNAGQTLLSIINDILDISKIESGKLELIPVNYDFSSLIHDVVNMMKIKAEAKELKFELFVDENIPSRLFGDDVRIRQILVNLLSNAVKYTEHGSVKLSVGGKINGDFVELSFSVKDTGIGIRKEDMEKLFAEFERLDEKKNRSIEGTGLGMSITKQLLGMMGSSLNVESVYGEGSEFSFVLKQKIMDLEPIGDLESRIKAQVSDYKYNELFRAPDARLLVVDDNSVNRKVFMSLLKSTHMQIDEAAGGEQCLEYVQKNKYDIIFLDHMMPGMDGIETLHKMRELSDYPCKDTPVVALTANAVTGAREMYINEGFNDFLSKPMNPEKTEKMIMNLLPRDKVVEGVQDNQAACEASEIEEAELPMLDGFDWEYALLHCHERQMLIDTIENLYKIIDDEALQLEDSFAIIAAGEENSTEYSEALKQFRVKVHSMKSSAAMIGAMFVSGTARMLEYAARDEKLEEIKNVTPYFLEEWRNMKKALEPFVSAKDKGKAGEDTESKSEPDKFLIVQFLGMLSNAIQNMDADTADEIIRQLKGYDYNNNEVDEILSKLENSVFNFDEEQTDFWSNKMKEKIEVLY